jgi:hypothetical protein
MLAATIVMTCAISAISSAQEASREDFDDFCKMIQGRWIGNVTWVTDWPGLGRKGDQATCYLDARPMADGNGMLGQFYGGSGSETILWMYDPGAKRIRGTAVDSGGTVTRLTYHKDGEKWSEHGEGSLPDGKETKHKATMHVGDDGDSLVFKGSGTIDGKPTDDRNDTWTRVYK